ncbi:MAG: hypothetical protein HXY40_00100 [Chloroflexi bacterium]|nr:hypothetical protein [Chloroflexota bacterium]
MRRKLLILIVILAAVLTVGALSAWSQDALATPEDAAIKYVAQSPDFAEWLAQYPNWQGYAYLADTDIYYVEFYDESGDEWLGYAVINLGTREIADSFIPRPLPPDVYAEQQARIQVLVLEDPEVLARLVDPLLWAMYSDFNRYEQTWDVYFVRGTEAILVRIELTEYSFSITEITDAFALSEEEALEDARNEAIMLAYSADGIEQALDGYDEWTTYTEHQGDGLWSVTFTAGGQELFFALVDVAVDEVLEAEVADG